MPLYEYTCQDCEHTFEALVYDGDTVACPECQGARVERLLSLPARPHSSGATLPTRCDSAGPPCGAPWCRKG
jgi:putative FmdB family regulatory protein